MTWVLGGGSLGFSMGKRGSHAAWALLAPKRAPEVQHTAKSFWISKFNLLEDVLFHVGMDVSLTHTT
jgi:hypothetical protein